jgi:decaprenylphospho-beta-D-ribofuranose 2-oxidase
MIELAGWGNYPVIATDVVTPRVPIDVPQLISSRGGLIARGQGRAYGDAAVGQPFTVSSLGLNRMIAFDGTNGRLTVEAGVTVADILRSFVPRGFFLKVVPGTKYVTIGGAIAADVHGKNHHRDGGFGDSLESLRLVLPSGETVTCSRAHNPDLFAATVGGMGLTGVIVEATLSLRPIETGWLKQQTRVADNVDEAVASLDSTTSYTYSVAWIDCLAKGSALGRSLIYAADHATARDRNMLGPELETFPPGRSSRPSVPIFMPGWILNHASISAFNELYFRQGAAGAGEPSLVHWDAYFFPLDAIGNWNRIYGRRGFVQYQCVIPSDNARDVLAEILGRVAHRGSVSFLAVPS